MKLFCRLLLIYLLGFGCVFAQNIAPTINASSCEKPAYPSASKRLTEEGTVQLKFLVGEDGRVIESAVEKSSGFLRLDEAARQGLTKCSFKPGIVNGVSAQNWASMKYTWRLEVFDPCIGSEVSKWRSCLGTLPTSGGLSVVEYEGGKQSGRGIEYNQSGSVIRSGLYDNGEFVSERKLDTKLFPFIARLQTSSTSTSIAQNKLPTCQGTQTSNWNNCFSTIKSSNGNVYVGEFVDGRMHGQGMYTYANGDKYTGENKFGKFSGTGELIYVDGRKYVGEFRDDKRNGKGIEYSSSGAVIQQGSWYNDKLEITFAVGNQRPTSSIPIEVAITSQPTPPNSAIAERERLAADLEVSNRKRQELEEQLRVSQQRAVDSKPVINTSIGKRIALVVGNANYKVRPLKNSVNDADDVSKSLKATGFEVIDLRDATLPQMRSAVRQFGDRLVSNDVGLVYYSGHGVEVKGRNYFIPVNADIQREDEIADQGLDVSLILEKMSTAGKGVNILIVDACRDDPFGRSFRSSSRGLAQMDAPRGTIIAYATSPGKVASDGDPRERNSPYTKHLVKAMQSPNKPIEQVFKEVRRAVQDETKNQQTPWENTSLSGDFYFKIEKAKRAD